MEDVWLDAVYHLGIQPSELEKLPVGKVRHVISAVKQIREQAPKEK